MLQFGHGVEAVETSSSFVDAHKAHCFNSATALKPWKRVSTPAERWRDRGFNSATALKPWKPA